ncbi:MAG: methyltransferase domain-containing protein [Chthoniobacterales bacterium]
MHASNSLLDLCPVCGNRQFTTEKILWPELIKAWGLTADEVDYINLQQGLCCTKCGNNLRSMTLAAALMNAFKFVGTFQDFCRTDPAIRHLAILEVNSAKNLTPFLQQLPGHTLKSFPQLDMQRMNYDDASIDIIIHSDTLEHVPDSRAALAESLRILKTGGHLFYTVPIIVGRLTRTRTGLPPSYHGQKKVAANDYVVRTEYGADFWCETFAAGFRKIELTSLIFPASVAIHATKS